VFTRMVMESPDWIATIVPVRDGVLVARWSPDGGSGADTSEATVTAHE